MVIDQARPKENSVVDQRMVEKENTEVDHRWFSVEHIKRLSDVEESLNCKEMELLKTGNMDDNGLKDAAQVGVNRWVYVDG
ncbi:hypothetical protein VKT23_015261 [Stygiomarasmius scandens]|uniref:Uncharacterized protein n=1 Tax=Marasmiellus scandens TaxID=2682957 RepID=A0ABR1IMQ6_9AGAR